MKANLPFIHGPALSHLSGSWRPLGLGILVLVYSSESFLAGNAVRMVPAELPVDNETLSFDPGPIGVLAVSPPAVWSYDLPAGQIQNAGAAAGAAAAEVLELPRLDPRADLPLSAIGLIAAPVAAVGSGVQAIRERLPAHKLVKVQAGLVGAMTNMAQQHHFVDAFMIVAKRESPRRFVVLSAWEGVGLQDGFHPVGRTILETKVVELRLAKLGASDASYVLKIQVRARLLRAFGGAVLSDTTFNYQTEPDLFLDWALNDGEPFMSCVRTGYRHIAAQIISDLNQRTGVALVVGGAGRKSYSPTPLRLVHASLQQQNHPISSVATVQLAAQPMNGAGNIYVIPSPAQEYFSVQKPLTREEALSEAMADIEWAMDGLDRHPNAVVVLTTFAVMSPVGLYHQTIGAAFSGVSKRNVTVATASVARVAKMLQPSQTLAVQVTRQLQQRDFVAVLAKPQDEASLSGLAQSSSSPDLHIVPAGRQNTATHPARAGDHWLQVEMIRAGLKGPEGSNPQLAVVLEARVTLRRAPDDEELHTATVRYVSESHKFSQWATEEARLLRQEIALGLNEISAAAIDKMVQQHWITPPRNHFPIVARN